mmetsp:Transcript_28469/g.73110  ORF Transcript_28469/g.73110 Transcript_28469/m.73110 type:complete len:287 (-) Transcript_28469:282-1142(-)
MIPRLASYSSSNSSNTSSNSSRGRDPDRLPSTALYTSSSFTRATYSFQRMRGAMRPSSRWRCSRSLNASRFLRSAKRRASLSRASCRRSSCSRSRRCSWKTSSASIRSMALKTSSSATRLCTLRQEEVALMLGSACSMALNAARPAWRATRLASRSLRSRSRRWSSNSSSRSRLDVNACQRESDSNSCAARANLLCEVSSGLSSSMAMKSSRALRMRWRASSRSSRLRCCRYSLKQAFFSPSDLSAPYRLSDTILRIACSHDQSELTPDSFSSPLNASLASALVAY